MAMLRASGVVLGLALCLPAVAAAAEGQPETAAELVTQGMRKFRNNDIAGSLKDFDRAALLDPKVAPQLWQRGLSDYYAGKYGDGRRQFELHQTVNPDDVENAAWHFLCVARVDGIAAARKSLLKIDVARDARVPMAEIYALYSGRGSPESVLQAAARDRSDQAAMYANLYLGLYFEAAGDTDKARTYVRKAAAATISRDYMHDVAKVHVRQRHWDR
jgi:lipoprotein NlpI